MDLFPKTIGTKEANKLADYIKTCELCKANNKTLSDAFNKCENTKIEEDSSTVRYVMVGILGILIGAAAGSALRGN